MNSLGSPLLPGLVVTPKITQGCEEHKSHMVKLISFSPIDPLTNQHPGDAGHGDQWCEPATREMGVQVSATGKILCLDQLLGKPTSVYQEEVKAPAAGLWL